MHVESLQISHCRPTVFFENMSMLQESEFEILVGLQSKGNPMLWVGEFPAQDFVQSGMKDPNCLQLMLQKQSSST